MTEPYTPTTDEVRDAYRRTRYYLDNATEDGDGYRAGGTEFTERQAAAWPDAVAEAQRYVDTSTISLDLRSPYWRVVWEPESRRGRGHLFDGTWIDGEYVVQIRMDVYGYPSVSVGRLDWVHSSSDEECPCEPCVTVREDEGGDGVWGTYQA